MGLMCTTEDNIKEVNIKSGQAIYKVLLDKEDFDLIKNKKLTVIKQHGHATVSLYLGDGYKQKKSLGKFILKTERNVYLRNRLILKDDKILDYRKNNLTVNIKDMVGYSDIARNNFFKNKDIIMEKRHQKGVYQACIADKIIKKKSGENNYRAKLTNQDIIDIREKYVPGLVTQDKLAKEYGVSRSTISSIVTYKRWRNFHLRDVSALDKNRVVSLSKKKYTKKYLSLVDFKDNSLLYLRDDNLVYYLEKVNDDGLIYFEVRNKENNVILRSDLLFKDELNSQTNREYSIAYKYPVRTPIKELVFYVDKLKEYI